MLWKQSTHCNVIHLGSVEPDNNSDSKPDNNDDSKRRSNKYVPMHIHDIYMGHVPPTFTEDAVHSYLRDIDIKHIIRVSNLLTHEKYAEFRVIIGDEDIKDTLYGTRKIYRDVVIMTFKEFRQNTNTHPRYCNRQSHDINNTGRTEKSENSRKDRHIEVENSRKKSYRSLVRNLLLTTRERGISNDLNCTIEQTLDIRYTKKIIPKTDHLLIYRARRTNS